MSTHATFLKDDYVNIFELKNKMILEEFIFAQEQLWVLVETWFAFLLFMQVQRGENILKGEQAKVEQGVQQIDLYKWNSK